MEVGSSSRRRLKPSFLARVCIARFSRNIDSPHEDSESSPRGHRDVVLDNDEGPSEDEGYNRKTSREKS